MAPGIPLIRAQNERLRGPPSGWGALSFDPVARLYLARPFAVSPPVLLFSPRPTERLGGLRRVLVLVIVQRPLESILEMAQICFDAPERVRHL